MSHENTKYTGCPAMPETSLSQALKNVREMQTGVLNRQLAGAQRRQAAKNWARAWSILREPGAVFSGRGAPAAALEVSPQRMNSRKSGHGGSLGAKNARAQPDRLEAA